MPFQSNPWQAPAGFDYKLIETTLEKANLQLGVIGSNGIPSAFAVNLAVASIRSMLKKVTRSDYGVAALTLRPTTSGTLVTIPAQHAAFDGTILYIRGASGPKQINVGGADGDYAVVLEVWDALVGPTTTSATVPVGATGVTDPANKRGSGEYYPQGDVSATISAEPTGGIGDSGTVAGALIQLQKFIQPQYRISVIPNGSLYGLTPPNLPSGVTTSNYLADADIAPYGARATTTNDSQSYGRTYSIYKLAVYTKTGSTLVELPSLDSAGNPVAGQTPVPIAPSRSSLGLSIFNLSNSLNLQILRLSAIEGATIVDSTTATLYYLVAQINPVSGNSGRVVIDINSATSGAGAPHGVKDSWVVANTASGVSVQDIRSDYRGGAGSSNYQLAVYDDSGIKKVWLVIPQGSGIALNVKANSWGLSSTWITPNGAINMATQPMQNSEPSGVRRYFSGVPTADIVGFSSRIGATEVDITAIYALLAASSIQQKFYFEPAALRGEYIVFRANQDINISALLGQNVTISIPGFSTVFNTGPGSAGFGPQMTAYLSFGAGLGSAGVDGRSDVSRDGGPSTDNGFNAIYAQQLLAIPNGLSGIPFFATAAPSEYIEKSPVIIYSQNNEFTFPTVVGGQTTVRPYLTIAPDNANAAGWAASGSSDSTSFRVVASARPTYFGGSFQDGLDGGLNPSSQKTTPLRCIIRRT